MKDPDEEQFDPNVYYYNNRDREQKLFEGNVPSPAVPAGPMNSYPVSMYPPARYVPNSYTSQPSGMRGHQIRAPSRVGTPTPINPNASDTTQFMNGTNVPKGQPTDWRSFSGGVPPSQMNGIMKPSAVSFSASNNVPSALRMSTGQPRPGMSHYSVPPSSSGIPPSAYRGHDPLSDMSAGMYGNVTYADATHVRREFAEYGPQQPQAPPQVTQSQAIQSQSQTSLTPQANLQSDVPNSGILQDTPEIEQRERERREREFPALPGYGTGNTGSGSVRSNLANSTTRDNSANGIFTGQRSTTPQPQVQSQLQQMQLPQQTQLQPSQLQQQQISKSPQKPSALRQSGQQPLTQSQTSQNLPQTQPQSQFPGRTSIEFPKQTSQIPGTQSQPATAGSQSASQTSSQPFQNQQSQQMGQPQQVQPLPPDNYGLTGLLRVLKVTDRNLATLASGFDLTTLGLNLSSTDVLYATFASPFSDAPLKREPEFHIPSCYYMRPPLPPPIDKMSLFSDETLFYIFYSMPRDALQVAAAAELQARDWTYHVEQKLWFQRLPGTTTTPSKNNYELGTYVYFDTQHWEKRRKTNFKMEYSKLYHL